jgi:uncharacterized membrane protein
MRYGQSFFRMAAFATAMTMIAACAGGEEAAETPDSAAAAAAAPPAVESFTLVSNDGSWSGDITPAGIVYRAKGRDSLVFEYKAPAVNGAISEYESLMTATDTARISINLAMTKCTDKAGTEYTHMAQIWLSGKQGGRPLSTQGSGCANKK